MRFNIEATLIKAPLFAELDTKVLESVAANSRAIRLDKDELLFLAGEPAKSLYVIADGAVRAFRTGIDGREQVIHVERAVTTIAEVPVFDGGTYPSTAAAETTATIYIIPRDVILDESRRHPDLALAAAKLLARRLRACAELVESLSLLEVGQRLARLLVEQALETGPDATGRFVVHRRLTHSQLAARVGTVREVVSRALSRLQALGLISIKGETIAIDDLENLSQYAGNNHLATNYPRRLRNR